MPEEDKGHPCLCDGFCKLERVEIPLPGEHVDPIRRYCKRNEEMRQKIESSIYSALGVPKAYIEDSVQAMSKAIVDASQK